MLTVFSSATPETLAALKDELALRKASRFVLLFSMGSQFDHLIVQSLSKLGIYCLVADPATVTADDVTLAAPAGIIVSGGPANVSDERPPFDDRIFDLGIPTLGVCLGFQMWAKHVGADVVAGASREYGVHLLDIIAKDVLFEGIDTATPVLQTHGDQIVQSDALITLGSTENAPVAAGVHKHLWGVQFHPEVSDTRDGLTMYENFCVRICGIADRFPAHKVAEQKVNELKERIASKRVLIALSGGSDSSVVAYLLKEAAKGSDASLKAVYIRGIDRPDDEAYVRTCFGECGWIDVEIVDATERFLVALKGRVHMRDKRVAMRGIYTEVLEEKIREFKADFIAQGTLYTDLRESGQGNKTGARVAEIKVHHNTGITFSVPELSPLASEVKDSARSIGRDIGVPEDLLVRHPFPGPGLVVRIEGEITAERLATARAVDGIYIEELRKANLYAGVWQAGATLTRSEHTESKGDGAGLGAVVALWAVWSVNGFTARWAKLPYEFLERVSRRITNEVHEVGAVVYRIGDKPPSTIEWG